MTDDDDGDGDGDDDDDADFDYDDGRVAAPRARLQQRPRAMMQNGDGWPRQEQGRNNDQGRQEQGRNNDQEMAAMHFLDPPPSRVELSVQSLLLQHRAGREAASRGARWCSEVIAHLGRASSEAASAAGAPAGASAAGNPGGVAGAAAAPAATM